MADEEGFGRPVDSTTAALGFAQAVWLRLLLPALIGAAAGTVVAGANELAEGRALTALSALPGAWPAAFSPLALVVTLAVFRWIVRASKPSTAELYILTYHHPGAGLPLAQIPGRVLGAMTTVAFGGSQGLESASALVGASFGDLLGRAQGAVPPEERRSLLVAGASAGIAAVFSSPAIGTLYGIEIPFRRDVDARRLVPCAVAASASFAVRDLLIGAEPIVVMDGIPRIDAELIAAVLVVAAACALGARLFARATEALKDLAQRVAPLGRAVAGGVALAGLAWLGHSITGRWITFGPGYIAAEWALGSSHLPLLLAAVLLVRACGTMLCVACGGGGGVFTSLACMGALIGEAVAQAIGRTESQALPFIGAACFLASGYRLPLACMMFVVEGATSVWLALAGLVAIAVGQVLMGDDSVSSAQRDHRID